MTKQLSLLLTFLFLAPALAAAQGGETRQWLGQTWDFQQFDNGHGLAGYTLYSERLTLAGAAPCAAQGEALFSRLESLEGAVYLPPPLKLRTNETRSYRLKGRVDMEATLLQGAGAASCGAQITVLNPIELPQ